jgi:hypothetical protein
MDQSLQVPFLAYFKPKYQALLVRLRGNFTIESTLALNRTARAVVERHGNVIAILDFTDIAEFAMDLRDWKELGHNRRAIRDRRRVLVAPDPQVRAMLALHGTHQSPSHKDDTSVVRTLEEAFRQLGIEAPKFEPLPI